MERFPIAEIPGFSATRAAHAALSPYLRPGDWAVDATAGNGHDTLFLAMAVHPGGRVFASDRQSAALETTRARLLSHNLEDGVQLILGDHAELAAKLPTEANGRLRAIIFNLGYLPGGDKSVVTQTASTLKALDHLSAFLALGGAVVVVAYRGHPGGAEECIAVCNWLTARTRLLPIKISATSAQTERPAPVLLLAEKQP